MTGHVDKGSIRISGGRSLAELVDAEQGLVSREIFVSQEIFELELELLFSRAWLFVGHTSQIPEPGDFFVSRMGTDSVILTRDAEGEVHVILNSCRHRGMRVCRYDEGNTLQFTCPYHGWAYSIDGSLVSTPGELYGVPQFHKTYGGKLERKDWGLVRVAKTFDYKGLIFATWDPDAMPFEEYVGDFHHWLDNLTDSLSGTAAGSRVFRGVQKWRVNSNWKLAAENFLGDMYHAQTSHASVEAVGIGPGGKGTSRHGTRPRKSVGATSFTHLGHGAATSRVDDERPYPRFEEPDLDDYFQQTWEQRRQRLTAEGRPITAFGASMLFPSMSFHPSGFPKSILVTHPHGPTQTEMWRWYLYDEDTPEPARDWLRHYYLRYSGPAGLTEQDDMENWDYATAASTGFIARRYPYNYQQGLGMGAPSRLRGAVESAAATEENARNFYRRWSGFVSGMDWKELAEQPE
jgi:phenylpropionate dioxygenase-like ring-hydroxylating dioxygenase large terminal subunit